MRKKSLRKEWRAQCGASLLLVAFLFAQAVVLTHDLDVDAYESDHACGICGVASVFGGANVAFAADFEIAAGDRSNDAGEIVAFLSRSVWQVRARDPPISI